MNIAVNTRLLIENKLEGLGRFAHETLMRIARNHPEHHFIFIFDRKYSDEFIYSNNITPVIAHPQARHPLLWYMFFEWGVPPVLNKHNAGLFLSPDGWLSLKTKVPSVPVIHDLNFFNNPEWIEWAPRNYYNFFFPKFIKKAERIVTVSNYSKHDIINRFPIPDNNIDVVYNGTSEGFSPISEQQKKEIRKNYTAGEEFFLFVGLVHPRKNLERIIRAFDSFKFLTESRVKLLIIGSTKYMTADVQKAYHRSPNRADIIFTGYVSDAELKKITASALALVYASLFEGFGIPILEAMHCDTPVITSSSSSMPEVGGNAVVYVDPYSVASISEAMRKVFTNTAFRQKIIEKARAQRAHFSWDKTAGLLWESIEKVIATVK
ncbi:MAG: glycosyltransferase family 4 protein [Bacteroidales bacterium]|nr:glycosyltransferase family 4 protein [Bacteroidales bacterium]